MLRKLRPRLTYANVVSSLCLFLVVAGGTAYAANTVFSTDIVDGEVKTVDLANAGVTNGKLAANSVNTGKVADNNLGAVDLAPGSVGTSEVADDTLGAVDFGPGSVGTSEVADGAITETKVVGGAITSATVLDDTQPGGGLFAEDLATDSVGPSEIQTNAIGPFEIAGNAVTSPAVRDFGLRNEDIGVLFAEVTSSPFAVTLSNSSGGVSVTRIGSTVGNGQFSVDFGRNITDCTAVATIGHAGTSGINPGGEVYVNDRAGNVEAVAVDTNTSTGAASDKPFRLVVVC